MYQHGDIFYSPGGSVRYRVVGAICRLYDREELPYPCCRLDWQGKEPFWNRQGKRFVPDLSASRCASYNVEVVDYNVGTLVSLYHKKLNSDEVAWWFTTTKKRQQHASETSIHNRCAKQSS